MKTKTIEDIEGKLVDIKNSLDAFRKYHINPAKRNVSLLQNEM